MKSRINSKIKEGIAALQAGDEATARSAKALSGSAWAQNLITRMRPFPAGSGVLPIYSSRQET